MDTRYRFIIFESMDCAGKSSIKREFDRQTKFAYLTFDRFATISSYVYNFVHSRRCDFMRYLLIDYLLNILFRPILVYIECDDDIIEKRLSERGDEYIKPQHIQFLKRRYNNYLKKTPFSVIRVDNSNGTIRKNTNGIVKAIKKL